MPRVAVLFVSMLVLAILCGPAAGSAAAQERGDTGITMGYPASVGMVWHVTDRLAVRPELSFSSRTTDDDAVGGRLSSDTWLFGLGVSGLFYVKEWDKLHAYVSPRYTYNRASTTTDIGLGSDIELRTSVHTIAGYFGTQYSLSDKFSVFGEVGVAVANTSARSSTITAGQDSTAISSTTGVGIIFYF